MSINNLLKANNYDIQVGTLSMNGGNQMSSYLEGSFDLNYVISNNAATGAFSIDYVKVGKLVTLAIKEESITTASGGYFTLSGLPSVLNPKKVSGPGPTFDLVEFPALYIKSSDSKYYDDWIFYVVGPFYGGPDSGYIVSNDVNASDIPAGTYTFQQQTFSYIAEE